MAVYEKDEKGALVPVKGDVPDEVYLAIERADEESIVRGLTEVEAQPFFAYAYTVKTKDGPKDIIGISVDGAKEIGRELGNIKCWPDFKVEERDDYLYCAIPVTDLSRNFTWIGVARQSKYMVGEGMVPSDRIDETAFVKAVNKAQRNGILGVAPQRAIAEIVSKLDPRVIKRLSSPPQGKSLAAPKPAKAAPAKVEESPEMNEIKSLRQQLHLKWDELQKLNPEAGDKKDWLKANYNYESSIELSLEQAREAVSKVDAMIVEKAGPQATNEEKKALGKEVVAFFGGGKEAQEKTLQLFRETTGKKGGWTKNDLAKIQAKIEEIKSETPPEAKSETDDFLREFE